jgi:hypothetical protein
MEPVGGAPVWFSERPLFPFRGSGYVDRWRWRLAKGFLKER